MAEKKENLHSGHRARVRQKFLRDSFDSFDSHEVLEMYLFYAIPYKDTNDLAHRLLKRYFSLAGVCGAPVDELMRDFKLSENAAVLLKMLPELTRRYYRDTRDSVGTEINLETVGEIMHPLFLGRTNEVVGLALGDAKGYYQFLDVIVYGSITTSELPIRKVVDYALRHNARTAFVGHNHPSGSLLPSVPDLDATRHIAATLSSIGVKLMDHYIFTDKGYTSLAKSGLMKDVFHYHF